MKNCLESLKDRTGHNLVGYIVVRDFSVAISNGYEKDDLMGYGFIGLVRAMQAYNGKSSFVNFACKKIRQEIISYLRQQCQRIYARGTALSYTQQYWGDSERLIDRRLDMEYYLSLVTTEQTKVLMLLYCYDWTWKEVCSEMGWTKDRLFKERNKALKTIHNGQGSIFFGRKTKIA